MITTVKERPILFSGPMVRALLAGTKTQTRRVVKPQPPAVWGGTSEVAALLQQCPYGQPGDRLWVRETWGTAVECIETDSGCFEGDYYTVYRAGRGPAGTPRKGWKPSIHMRRSDSRILLDIVSVRVERLQDISEEDAKAEGIEAIEVPTRFTVPAKRWKNYLGRAYCEGMNLSYPVESYQTLWESINGPDSWQANPWVWVVEFKRIES